MNEYEIGKEITKLSSRIAGLESRILGKSTLGGELVDVKQVSSDSFLDNEFAFKVRYAYRPGSCPSSFTAKWVNKKTQVTACASSAEQAQDRIDEDDVKDTIKDMVRNAAGLECSTRGGCADPSTCQEDWKWDTADQEGNWTCVDTEEQDNCDDEETKWTCTGWFTIKVRLKCKCVRPA